MGEQPSAVERFAVIGAVMRITNKIIVPCDKRLFDFFSKECLDFRLTCQL